jgi:cytochrome c oxidase subunit 2
VIWLAGLDEGRLIKMKTRKHLRHTMPTKTRKNSLIPRIAYTSIVVVVLGFAAYLLVSAFSSPVPSPADNTVDVSAAMDGFDRDIVRVKVGDTVTLRLTSLDNSHHTDGGGQHQWAVDELGLNVIAPPLGSNSITFTATEAGTYEFYCDICCGGRANPTMQGTLIVEA